MDPLLGSFLATWTVTAWIEGVKAWREASAGELVQGPSVDSGGYLSTLPVVASVKAGLQISIETYPVSHQ